MKLPWTLNSPVESTESHSGNNPEDQTPDPNTESQEIEGSDDLDWSKQSGVDDESIETPVDDEIPGDKTSPDDETPEPGTEPGKEKPAPRPDEGKTPAPAKAETPEEEKPEPQRQEEKPPPQETPEQKAERERREAEERKQATQKLEEYYKLPDDLAARLATEPETVLPVMAARLHETVMRGVQEVVARAVPQMLHQYQTVTKANEESRSKFYDRWPSLKAHEEQVLQIGQMFRQMNPKATPQDALEKIGKLACAALGITEDQPKGRSGQSPAPRRPNNQPRRPGFRPAAVEGSQGGNSPPAENVFTELAEEFIDEDRGG